MTPELWRRIGFTLVALLVFRIGCNIPLPGVDLDRLATVPPAGVLSDGARFSIFALNLIPYVSAAILVQIALFLSRRLRAVAESGHRGRSRIETVTLLLTVALAAFQGTGIANALESGPGLVMAPGAGFRITIILCLAGGALSVVLLANQITQRGVSNGVALILFAGVAPELPRQAAMATELLRQGLVPPSAVLLLFVFAVVITALIVTVELARRELPVERADGRGRSVLSAKLNPAGIMPSILAPWLMALLVLIPSLWESVNEEQARALAAALRPGGALYIGILGGVIVIVSLVYTAFLWDPNVIAKHLKAHGLVLPGVAPGEETLAHLDRTVSPYAFVGALYLILVAVVPQILFQALALPFYFGGIALLVVVCTVLDIVARFQAERAYGGERR